MKDYNTRDNAMTQDHDIKTMLKRMDIPEHDPALADRILAQAHTQSANTTLATRLRTLFLPLAAVTATAAGVTIAVLLWPADNPYTVNGVDILADVEFAEETEEFNLSMF